MSKGKGHPITAHEDPKGEYRYSCILFLTLALDGVGGQRHALSTLPPGKRHDTYCTGDRVGPRAGLDGCGNFVPTAIRSPDRPDRSQLL